MELFSIPILSLIAGFIALVVGVKVIARNDEISQVWQIAFAAIVLFGIEVGLNYVVHRFAPDFTPLILVMIVMTGVGISVSLTSAVFFAVPFSRAVIIALLFMVTKGAVAIHFGSKEFGEYHSESRLVTLYERKISGTGDLSTLRNPRWSVYEVGELSMALPEEPEDDYPGAQRGQSKGYHSSYVQSIEFGKAKLDIEYWDYRKESSIDPASTIREILDAYAYDNPSASVDLVEKDFETEDKTLNAMRGLLWIGDPSTDPLAVPVYFLSITRGREEWFLRASGDKRTVEQMAQFTFSSIKVNTPEKREERSDSDAKTKDLPDSKSENASETESVPTAEPKKPAYPIQRTLTNSEGKIIEVEIIGRSTSKLVFRAGNQEFRYDISSLSEEDQAFVQGLPLTEQ